MIRASFDEICKGLYISDTYAASNFTLLRDKKITHILICAVELSEYFPEDFIYKKLDLKDDFAFNISYFFDESFQFIHDARTQGGRVLVHCFQGKSRSASIVIAYLISEFKLSYRKALRKTRQAHPGTGPNIGFTEQLKAFGNKIKAEKKRNPRTCLVL